MAVFSRFDICVAYALLEAHYNKDGILWERPSNRRRNESTGCQLARIGYSNPYCSGIMEADENVQDIYFKKVLEWKLPIDAEYKEKLEEIFIWDFLYHTRPDIWPLPM